MRSKQEVVAFSSAFWRHFSWPLVSKCSDQKRVKIDWFWSYKLAPLPSQRGKGWSQLRVVPCSQVRMECPISWYPGRHSKEIDWPTLKPAPTTTPYRNGSGSGHSCSSYAERMERAITIIIQLERDLPLSHKVSYWAVKWNNSWDKHSVLLTHVNAAFQQRKSAEWLLLSAHWCDDHYGHLQMLTTKLFQILCCCLKLPINSHNRQRSSSCERSAFRQQQCSVLYFYFPSLIPLPHLSVVLPLQPPTAASSLNRSYQRKKKMPRAGLTCAGGVWGTHQR